MFRTKAALPYIHWLRVSLLFRNLRTATNLGLLDLTGVVLTLAGAVLLTGKLRKVDDICRLSSDTQRIGAVMVGIVCEDLQLPPPPRQTTPHDELK